MCLPECTRRDGLQRRQGSNATVRVGGMELRPSKRLKSRLCVNTLTAKMKESRHSEVHNIISVLSLLVGLPFIDLFLVPWFGGGASYKATKQTKQVPNIAPNDTKKVPTWDPKSSRSRCKIEPAPRRRSGSVSGGQNVSAQSREGLFWDLFWDQFFLQIEKIPFEKASKNQYNKNVDI